MTDKVDQVLDATNLQCPMPLLKAKQALNQLAAGQVLHVIATDAGSWRDFHSYCEQSSHQLLKASQSNGVYSYWVQKAEV